MEEEDELEGLKRDKMEAIKEDVGFGWVREGLDGPGWVDEVDGGTPSDPFGVEGEALFEDDGLGASRPLSRVVAVAAAATLRRSLKSAHISLVASAKNS